MSKPCLAEPTAAQDINIVYLGDHAYLDADVDAVTIPDRHLELIMLYMRWAAFQELATTESSNPDPTRLALSTRSRCTQRRGCTQPNSTPTAPSASIFNP